MIDRGLSDAFAESWPPAETVRAGGFLVGRGCGGGGRVSSAVADGRWSDADIAAAEAAHARWGQQPMFRVPHGDAVLSAALVARGYAAQTPTLVLEAPVAALVDPPLSPMRCFAIWPPLAIQRSIWQAGGIDAPRQAVMGRVALPKAALLARIADRAAGAGFVALAGDVAMLHAVDVVRNFRRKGVGGWIVRRAAIWAAEHQGVRLALAVTQGNLAARALYDRMGFREAGGYAYYVRP